MASLLLHKKVSNSLSDPLPNSSLWLHTHLCLMLYQHFHYKHFRILWFNHCWNPALDAWSWKAFL